MSDGDGMGENYNENREHDLQKENDDLRRQAFGA